MKKAIAITLCILSLFTVGCEKNPYPPVETGNPEIQSFYNMPDKIIVSKYDKEVEIEKNDKNYKKIMDLIEYSQKDEIFKKYTMIDFSDSPLIKSSSGYLINKNNDGYSIIFVYNEPQDFTLNKSSENELQINNIKSIWIQPEKYKNEHITFPGILYSEDLYLEWASDGDNNFLQLAGPVFLAENYIEVLDEILK